MRAAAPALLIYLAVTLPLAFILNVWQDDAYTLHTTRDGLGYAFWQATTFEANAPLYFLLVTLWRHLNESAVWARLFSVACAAGTVLGIPALVRRYVPGLPAPAIAIAVAVNPFLIWSALEIRTYALVIFLSVLLLYFFYEAFLPQRPDRRALIAYAAVSLVSAYTQYYLLFLIAAQGAVLLVRRRSAFFAYVCAEAVVVFLLLPIVSIALAQMSAFRGGLTPPSLANSIKWLSEILAVYVLPLNALPHGHVLYVAAAAGAAIAAIVLGRRHASRGDATMVLMLAFAYVLFAGILYLAKEPMFTRHPSSLFVPAMLAVFSVFTFLLPPWRTRAFLTYVVLLTAIEITALALTYRHLAKPGDWRRVASYIAAHERSHETILVFEAESALPLQYYYHGKNDIVPIPRPIDFRTFDQRAFVVKDSSDIDASIGRVHAFGSVWLVTAGGCNAENIQFGCAVIEQYVRTHYRVITVVHFYKATVRFLKPRSP